MSGPEVWELARFGAGAACIAAGLLFVFAGAVGVLRLPDFYTRLHAAGVTDTLGAELTLLGLAIHAGWSLLAAKILLVGVFLFITTPTAAHAIAHAAHKAGLAPRLGPQGAARRAEDGGA